MSERDPRRWLDAESPADAALGELLDAGREELPSAAQLRALAERLGPPFDGPPSDGGGGGAAAPAVPIGPLVSAAAAIVALGGWWWLHTGSADDSISRASKPAPAASAPAKAAANPAPGLPGAPHSAPPGAPSPAAADAGAARAPERAAPRSRPSRPARPHDALAELELLEQAHRALASEPARALAATDTHAQRFANSQYAQERELIAIEALLRLGRLDDARVRGERFLALHPRSSHARKVRSLIAARPAPAPDAAVAPAAPNAAVAPAAPDAGVVPP
jgi:hypothetical protein